MRLLAVLALAFLVGCSTLSPLASPVTVLPFQSGTVVFLSSHERIQFACWSVQRTAENQLAMACYEEATRTLYCVYGDDARCWHEMLHHLGFTHPVGGGPWTAPESVKGQ